MPTEALRSVHTSNLPEIFEQLRISLAASTYQAGKVIVIRNDQGVLNTQFRGFAKPMGLAADGARLTIDGTNTVWYYRNVAAVAQKNRTPREIRWCHLPRRIHVTGDIDIHELAWNKEGSFGWSTPASAVSAPSMPITVFIPRPRGLDPGLWRYGPGSADHRRHRGGASRGRVGQTGLVAAC